MKIKKKITRGRCHSLHLSRLQLASMLHLHLVKMHFASFKTAICIASCNTHKFATCIAVALQKCIWQKCNLHRSRSSHETAGDNATPQERWNNNSPFKGVLFRAMQVERQDQDDGRRRYSPYDHDRALFRWKVEGRRHGSGWTARRGWHFDERRC